jgi:hypothetical protein
VDSSGSDPFSSQTALDSRVGQQHLSELLFLDLIRLQHAQRHVHASTDALGDALLAQHHASVQA